MSEINFRPNDKILSTSEIFKNLGIVIVGIGFFDFLFYMIYIEDGNIFPFIFCGIPLSLIIIAFIWQTLMHMLGFGKMVKNGNEIVLRTSRSGTSKPSRFSSIGRIFTFPIAKGIMSDVDKDGDGKVSFEEWMEDLYPDVTSKSEFKELRDEFDRFDVDGDGYITLKELQDSLLKGENWAEEKPEVEDKPDDWWSDEDN